VRSARRKAASSERTRATAERADEQEEHGGL